jgi:MFS transporter, FSR family, fosmidomycin resistance protein
LSAAANVALWVTLAHGVNDAYTSFLNPLLPRLMSQMGLSIALAATLATTLSLSTSLLQPLTGYAADRIGRKPFVVLGPLFSGVFLSLMGGAHSFAALALLLVVGGMGSAAFHPPGASLAARISQGPGSGVRYSVFSFGGTTGYALGPLIAVGIVESLGLERLWVAMIPALLLAVVLVVMLPADHGTARVAPPPPPRQVLASLAGPLGVVFGISAVQSFVQRAYMTMEPIINAAAGGSEGAGAVMLSVYLGGTALGTLAGGVLADRVDRRRLFLTLTILALPAHLAALGLPPTRPLTFVAAAFAGMTIMAFLPPIVVVAQESMPAGAAVSSGIVMGLAWATGAIAVLATGALGDVVGARSAALWSMLVLLIGSGLALHPALRLHRRPPT